MLLHAISRTAPVNNPARPALTALVHLAIHSSVSDWLQGGRPRFDSRHKRQHFSLHRRRKDYQWLSPRSSAAEALS